MLPLLGSMATSRKVSPASQSVMGGATKGKGRGNGPGSDDKVPAVTLKVLVWHNKE